MPDPAPQPGSTDVRRPSQNVARMGRGGGLNLVGALCYQGALFVILSVLARLGEQDVGRYASCFALLSLLSLLSLAGFRAGMTRFVAMHLADGDARRLRGTIRMGLWLTAVASVLIAGALALLAPWVAGVLQDPSLEQGVRLIALTLPAATFTDAALAATQGWRTQKPFTLVGRIFEPLTRLGLTVAAVALGLGLEGALWSVVIASWTTALVAGEVLRRRVRTAPREGAVYEIKEIFSFSMVSWVSALAATGLIWADTLIIGAMQGQAEVGTYSVASRLVMLAVFVMAPLNAAFTPHMAHLYHTGELQEASRVYGSASRWILTLSLPAFVMLVVFPEDLLSYFGPAFVTAAGVTAILACGQLVSAAAGPCGTVLNMSGRVTLNMVDNLAVLVGNVVLNLLLIPPLGVIGAAIAWSASLIVVNVAKVLQARYVVGVRAAGAGLGKVMLATVPTVAVAWALSLVVHGWVAAVLVAGPVVVAVFFGAVAAMGLAPDDRAMVRSVLRKRRLVVAAPSR